MFVSHWLECVVVKMLFNLAGMCSGQNIGLTFDVTSRDQNVDFTLDGICNGQNVGVSIACICG
jgi:hypothetical protein